MLEAIAVCKAFDGKPVLRDFSLRLAPGDRYCLMGPSGCGKTTALRLLMGLLKPDSGEIRGLNGLKLSVVFQENRLLEQLTAVDNLRLVSPAPESDITAMLLQTGLDAKSLTLPVRDFSGGMKRRVALCRALIADYDILFLDEPFKGLDDETKAKVMAMVNHSTDGKTVVMVTHDSREAAGYEVLALKPLSGHEE